MNPALFAVVDMVLLKRRADALIHAGRVQTSRSVASVMAAHRALGAWRALWGAL